MKKVYNPEKVAKVIELYQQNKTVREIARIVHMSFGDICDIIREYNEKQAQLNNLENSDVYEETKAMKLFFQGKSPIEVRIYLNISTEKVEAYYKNYWKLTGLYELQTIYDNDIKDNLPSFLKLFKKVRQIGISESKIVRALHYLDILPKLDNAVKEKRSEVKSLATQKDDIILELDELDNSKAQSELLLDDVHSEIQRASSELRKKQTILGNLTKRMHELLSGNDFLNIKNLVIQTASSVLDNRQDMLTAAIVTAIQGIQYDPNKGFLISYLQNSCVDNIDYGFGNTDEKSCHLDLKKIHDYIITYHVPIHELTDMLYDRILNIVQYTIFYKARSLSLHTDQ